MKKDKNPQRCVALLRGVNVGGKNILPMKALCALLESEGFEHVKSYIQSGNVVFDATKSLSAKLGEIICSRFGFEPEVLLLERDIFLDIIKYCPFETLEGNKLHFYFCQKTPILNEEKLLALLSPTEEYLLHGKVFYLYAPDGIGRSKLVVKLESCLGVPATGRNFNTVSKIALMF